MYYNCQCEHCGNVLTLEIDKADNRVIWDRICEECDHVFSGGEYDKIIEDATADIESAKIDYVADYEIDNVYRYDK